jgi:hypothetical protein
VGAKGQHRVREITSMCERVGLECLQAFMKRNGHYEARVRADDGREFRAIFPGTPSDHRSGKNQLALLRRFARGDIS